MTKSARVEPLVHELIQQRWSPRDFAQRLVSADHLASLLEAARWAPSSYNEQPWRFIVATRDDGEAHARLLACLVEGNRQWARHAPVLLLSVAALNFRRNGEPNRHAFHDVGLASAQLTLQATALGLQVHLIAGFDVAAARETYGIPDSYEPVAAAAIGYPGDQVAISNGVRGLESASRQRIPMKETVFTGTWGCPVRMVGKGNPDAEL